MKIVEENLDAFDGFERECMFALSGGRNEKTEEYITLLLKNHFGLPIDGMTTVESLDSRMIGIFEVGAIASVQTVNRQGRLQTERHHRLELGHVVKVRRAKAMLVRVMKNLGVEAVFHFPPYELTPEQETAYRLGGLEAFLSMVNQ